MKQFALLLLLCLCGVIFTFGQPEARGMSGVTFEDPNLEAAVRDTLELAEGEVTESDMLGLTSLSASNSGIVSLSGLEAAVNLTALMVPSNAISDLGPLADLTDLETLNLGGNEVVEIGPLENLTRLKSLVLAANEIEDIGPLTNLGSLEELLMQQNQVRNVDPIGNLARLKVLSISDNLITDISALNDLVQLEELVIVRNYLVTDDGWPASIVFDSLEAGGTEVFAAHQHPAVLALNPYVERFAPAADTGGIQVRAEIPWNATSNDSWIEIESGDSGAGNGAVDYSVEGNASPDSRSGTITVEVEDWVETLTVVQEGWNLELHPLQREHSPGNESGGFRVAANVSWSATAEADWIELVGDISASGDGEISYSVQTNESGEERSGTIVVTGEGLQRIFTVNQAAPVSEPVFWEQVSTPISDPVDRVVFGNDTFLALARQPGGEAIIWRSTDGVSWEKGDRAIEDVAFGDGLFVAVANTQNGRKVLLSDDGFVWREGTEYPANNALGKILFDGEHFWTIPGEDGGMIHVFNAGLYWSLEDPSSEHLSVFWDWMGQLPPDYAHLALHDDGLYGVSPEGLMRLDPDGPEWVLVASMPPVRGLVSVAGRLLSLGTGETPSDFWIGVNGMEFRVGADAIDVIDEAGGRAWVFNEGGAMSSSDGIRWGDRSHGLGGLTPNAVAAGNGLLVGGGDEGAIFRRPESLEPVIISSPPADVGVREHAPLRLALEAEGTEELEVAWEKDGVPVAGGDGLTLEIARASAEDAGEYQATVSNVMGSATSAAITVSVLPWDASDDPHKWDEVAELDFRLYWIEGGENGYVALGGDEPFEPLNTLGNAFNRGAWSADGTSWYEVRWREDWASIHYLDGRFYLGGRGYVATSEDGIGWETLSLDGWYQEPITLVDVIEEDLIAAGQGGWFRSPDDGQTWQSQPAIPEHPRSLLTEEDHVLLATRSGLWQRFSEHDSWTRTRFDPHFALVRGNDRQLTVRDEDFSVSAGQKGTARPAEIAAARSISHSGGSFAAIDSEGGVRTSNDGLWWTERSDGLSGVLLNDSVGGDPFLFAVADDGRVFRRTAGMEPAFVVQPRNASGIAGDLVRFRAEAQGSGEITYQWHHDGATIPGATSDTLILSETSAADSGEYFARAVNEYGAASSEAATLLVSDGPVEDADRWTQAGELESGMEDILEIVTIDDTTVVTPQSINDWGVVSHAGGAWIEVGGMGVSNARLHSAGGRFVKTVWDHGVATTRVSISDDGFWWESFVPDWEGVSSFSRIVDVTYGNGMYVAALQTPPGGPTPVVSSQDLRTFRREGDVVVARSVSFGSGHFVAVPPVSAGDALHVYVSTDGKSWDRHDLGATAASSFVRIFHGNGWFVLVNWTGGMADPAHFYRSSEGISWEHTASFPAANFWFAGKNFWAGNRVSEDGLDWAERDFAIEGGESPLLIQEGDFDILALEGSRIRRRSARLEPAIFPTLPAGASGYSGDSVRLEASAHGEKPISYQWFYEGDLLPAENGPVLEIDSLSDADSGNYRVQASNAAGEDWSHEMFIRHIDDYDGWAAEFGVGAPEEDAAGLGVPNLVRYAMHLDPERPEREKLPRFYFAEHEGERFPAVAFSWLDGVDDIEWVVESSTDLNQWEVLDEGIVERDELTGRERGIGVRTPEPLSEGNRLFLRVRVKRVEE